MLWHKIPQLLYAALSSTTLINDDNVNPPRQGNYRRHMLWKFQGAQRKTYNVKHQLYQQTYYCGTYMEISQKIWVYSVAKRWLTLKPIYPQCNICPLSKQVSLFFTSKCYNRVIHHLSGGVRDKCPVVNTYVNIVDNPLYECDVDTGRTPLSDIPLCVTVVVWHSITSRYHR